MSEHHPAEDFSAMASAEAEIRDLIQTAGPRPAVPSEDLARLRGVAKERWREMVKVERERARFGRRNTLLALAASLLLAVTLGWWLMPEFWGVAPERVATVELLRGDVLVDGSRGTRGSDLSAGTVLETGPEASGVALRLPGAQSVRLDRSTRVRLISDSSLQLERGAAYVDTYHAAHGAEIEVSTSFGRVRDIGTQFLVRVGDRGTARLTVRVREGEVVFERSSGTHSARAGEELTLLRDSDEVETAPIDRHGEAWTWVESVTPAMDIEGAPLSDYLEWVSRETGRELRYADAALAESAKIITLSGNIEDHTPEESLSILPGSGLGHRIENGWLLIEQPQE